MERAELRYVGNDSYRSVTVILRTFRVLSCSRGLTLAWHGAFKYIGP